jgi:two-component system phosphate regulon response regulator PhoB
VATRLQREGYKVDVAHDGGEGLNRIRSQPPDLVLLDIMLPGMPGTQVLRVLRADPRTSAIPVVMLTARSADVDQVVGLALGADDYITKPFSMAVLAARVAAVLRRAATRVESDGRPIQAGDIVIDPQRHEVRVSGKPVALTRTEFRLLLAMAAARGRVLSRSQLIDQTLGPQTVVTDRTIDVHLTALRRKLGSSRRHIKTVRGAGYRLAVDENETP